MISHVLRREGQGYAPPRAGRVAALIGTCLIYALALVGFFITTRKADSVPARFPATLVTMAPSVASNTPPQEKSLERPARKKELVHQALARQVVQNAPDDAEPTAELSNGARADPGPPPQETAAPKPAPAAPLPQPSSTGVETWEGKLLAALQRHRRYPSNARSRHQQGVPYIRFIIDREGKVLSSSLERSSGFPDLDQEAIALPKRAQPLPKPPAERLGATLELVVPVEFFLRS